MMRKEERMNEKIILRSIGLKLTFIICGFVAGCQTKNEDMKILVEINYGTKIEKSEVTLNGNKSVSALEATLHAAKVETHPVGQYVFVVSINDVAGVRGVNAWYYEINGKPANVLAINYEIKSGDRITWIYRKDVCSALVDKKL
jgi:hypothetical protein